MSTVERVFRGARQSTASRWLHRRAPTAAIVSVAIATACSNSSPVQLPVLLRGPQTLHVDCVAVLGTMPHSARTPLAALPYSGAPREKVIADLSDSELAKLADLDACLMGNGFSETCYNKGPKFVVEVPALISGPALSCYPTLVDDPSAKPYDNSRESLMYIFRNQFGSCPVGPLEDCWREQSVTPWGVDDLGLWSRDCYSTAIANCGW